MIKAAVLDAMVAAGCTAEQIAAAVKADQADRSSGAARQARYRARKASHVTDSDVTSVTVTDVPSPKEKSPTPPKEITPSTLRCDARDPLAGRANDMLDALGITDETKTAGFLILSDPYRWIMGGCDIDLDILPALRAIRAKGATPRSWAYCSGAVFEARDRRIAPPPAVQQRTATGPPSKAKPRNAGESARLELIRRGEYPNAADDSTRHDHKGDRNAGFAGSDIARRIALAASR